MAVANIASPIIPLRGPGPFPFPLPVGFPDGTLLKASGPEIDLVQGHERRWVPDPQTFDYMGLNWGALQVISDAAWNLIPAGPPFPSRADGTLLKGSGPQIYVMQGGLRRWIPDPATFNARGYSWSAVLDVTDSDLNAIPLGAQVPEGGVQPAFPIIKTQDDNFPGSGGFMHTSAAIYASGLMNAVTHTWEVTDLRGFRGSVAVAALDTDQNTLWVSATQHFGVDGRWIGTSDRNDNWSDNLPPAVLPNIRYLAIIQKWDPNDVYNDIQRWLGGIGSVASQLGPIIQTVTTIAATV